MTSSLKLIFCGAGSLLMIPLLVTGIWAGRFSDISSGLPERIYPVPCLSGSGFALINALNIKKEFLSSKRKVRYMTVFGQQNAEFYCMASDAWFCSVLMLTLPLSFFVPVFIGEAVMAPLLIAAGCAAGYLPEYRIIREADNSAESILAELPEILSRLTLLIGAGLVLRDAWRLAAGDGKTLLRREMLKTSEDIANGISEQEALLAFSRRCPVKETRHLASVISQNLSKGGRELSVSLRYMNDESWQDRKTRAVIKGQTANQKLIIPLMIMFAGILMMIIIPLFAGII